MSETPFDDRIDMLMELLMVLHENGVITDPAVSTVRAEDGNGTEVTVEFLLGYDARAGIADTETPRHE